MGGGDVAGEVDDVGGRLDAGGDVAGEVDGRVDAGGDVA